MAIKIIKKIDANKVTLAPVKKVSMESTVKSWITETQISKMQAQLEARKFWGLK